MRSTLRAQDMVGASGINRGSEAEKKVQNPNNVFGT